MSDEVAADGVGRLQRFWAEHFLVDLALVLILTVLGGGCVVGFALVTQDTSPNLLVGLEVFAIAAAGMTLWSIVTTFQRAVLIALGSESAPRTLRDACRDAALAARALLALGVSIGVYTAGAMGLGALAVLAARHAPDGFPIVLAWCAWCFAGWMATRAFLGIATASIVLGGETLWVACRNSARQSASHRLACISTRRLLVPPAATAAALFALALTTAAHSLVWLLAAVFFLPIVVSIDAAMEAAWYDRLRARVDAKDVAAVFS